MQDDDERSKKGKEGKETWKEERIQESNVTVSWPEISFKNSSSYTSRQKSKKI
jgi:hypothetical protein